MLGALGKVATGFTTFEAGASEIMGGFFETLSNGFADSIGRAIIYSEDLGDSLRKLAKDALAQLISAFVKLMIQMAAAKLVAAAFGVEISGIGGGTATAGASGGSQAGFWAKLAASVIGSAIGGAVGGGASSSQLGWGVGGSSVSGMTNNQMVMYNANGNLLTASLQHGLYTTPTYFPMSSPGSHAFARGAGLLGEAGPEFVMPATRLPNGKMGVSAVGGGGGGLNVTVNNHAAGDGYQAQVKQDSNGGLTLDIVRAAIAADFQKGGTKVSRAAEGAYSNLRRGR
jgi:hypothetical protein